MDITHKVLNILVPVTMLPMVLLLLPPYLVFKVLSYVKRYFFAEEVKGKVVVITGASSGIGEHLAYEYARRGASLAIAARREDRLKAIADKAKLMGSPDVLVIRADVTKVDDCERLISEALHHFGRLDHLVNNAGIIRIGLFEDCNDISEYESLMNTNFWGSVKPTHYAIPHLRKSRGRIIVVSSLSGWCPMPRLSFYGAIKAALISLYETLSMELGSDIGITIVTPGFIESDMSRMQNLSKLKVAFLPVESASRCAKAIVDSACRGERYLTEPSWAGAAYVLKVIFPEIVEWCGHLLVVGKNSARNA